MNQGISAKERRRHPRLAGTVPVKIYSDEFDIVTETKNLSRSGVYCQVNKYIEPMTKLKIHLLLSSKKGAKTVTKKISCEGVIVRAESAPNTENFNIAIYFNEIQPKDAEAVARFVETMLNSHPASSAAAS